MRTLALVLVVASLFVIAPAADAAPPSGGDCDVNEGYFRDASVDVDAREPSVSVTPGQGKPLDCTY